MPPETLKERERSAILELLLATTKAWLNALLRPEMHIVPPVLSVETMEQFDSLILQEMSKARVALPITTSL